jgi:hypothetical protein
MTDTKPGFTDNPDTQDIPVARLWSGGFFFIFGFLCPLFIPLVYRLDLPVIWQTTLAGFLALGIPELFMIIAVAILGKEGFNFVKKKLLSVFKPLAPPDTVSIGRYRFGLILFCIPLLMGWMLPYFDHLIPFYDQYELLINAGGDILLLISLFVLGGDFWDKVRGLFYHQAKIQFHNQ